MLNHLSMNQAVVLALGATASWTDLRTRRIPNLVTFGGAALALAFALVEHGLSGLLVSGAGWLTGVGIFLPFFLLGGMGAGDLKLVACFGAWLGPEAALWTALYAAVAGGVLAVGVALAAGYLRQALFNVAALLSHWRAAGLHPMPDLTLERARGPRLPYALPIALGAAATIWFR